MPVPSEIVMPFAGYLVWEGSTDMTFWGIVIVGSLGCMIGSIAAYGAGYYAGRPLILRYGKFFLITEKHLVMAEKWFQKYGPAATFIARLLPVIRTIISLPAGVAKMDFKKLVLYSFLGSLPWNAALAYVGFALGPKWEDIRGIFHYLDIAVVAGLAAFIIYYVWTVVKEDRKKEDKAP
jgi:membrane protein DedA with SNARE-associated domain